MIVWATVPKGKHSKKPTTVAKATIVFHHAGAAKLKVALTGAGRKLLKKAASIKLKDTATFTPAGQKSTSLSKALTLKR